MNFLSHYYFERYAAEPEQVLGGLLPDFLKNVDKKYSFQLSKYEDKLTGNPKFCLISEGWNRHVEVDKIFHSCDFFYQHTHQLRKEIEDVVEDLPIRASFLAHIGLELLLDHRLIVHDQLNVDRLYENLEQADRKALAQYLSFFEIIDVDRFFQFLDRFIASRYIHEYGDIKNIPHALFNICKRVWKFEPTQAHIDELGERLTMYNDQQLTYYKDIYSFIQDKLS